jgi:hypothetical protein
MKPQHGQAHGLHGFFRRVRVASLFTLILASLAVSLAGATPHAPPVRQVYEFREQVVSFQNGDIKLTGTLLLPITDNPVPAVVFAHGAAHAERRGQRDVADYFACKGIPVGSPTTI